MNGWTDSVNNLWTLSICNVFLQRFLQIIFDLKHSPWKHIQVLIIFPWTEAWPWLSVVRLSTFQSRPSGDRRGREWGGGRRAPGARPTRGSAARPGGWRWGRETVPWLLCLQRKPSTNIVLDHGREDRQKLSRDEDHHKKVCSKDQPSHQ